MSTIKERKEGKKKRKIKGRKSKIKNSSVQKYTKFPANKTKIVRPQEN
jgi:hypothetical protein